MRRYFPELLGNEKTKERIGAAIENGTLPHALLIGGASGSGKSTLAVQIAAALNCENKENSSFSLPCGRCNCCKRISELNFPDFKILSKPRDRATLGVEAIKDFREDMFLSSTESDYKIYVIDDAETMTTEAQNALLKVLEEPPLGVLIMILTTEGDKILTTIKSRAQFIPMARFTDEELKKHLCEISQDARELLRESPERFNSVISVADGRLGEAMRLSGKRLSAECAEERGAILNIVRGFCSKRDYKELLDAISYLPTKRAELIPALERVISALRDLIAIKQSENVRLVFFTSREEAREVCGAATVKRLLDIYDCVCRAHLMCVRNANVSNLLASLAAKIRLI